MSEIVRFNFGEGGDRAGIEEDACLAIFVSECIYGRPKTRLSVSYLVDEDGNRCVLRAHGEAGESALQVFIGLCEERFGEDGFTVEHTNSKASL